MEYHFHDMPCPTNDQTRNTVHQSSKHAHRLMAGSTRWIHMVKNASIESVPELGPSFEGTIQWGGAQEEAPTTQENDWLKDESMNYHQGLLGPSFWGLIFVMFFDGFMVENFLTKIASENSWRRHPRKENEPLKTGSCGGSDAGLPPHIPIVCIKMHKYICPRYLT